MFRLGGHFKLDIGSKINIIEGHFENNTGGIAGNHPLSVCGMCYKNDSVSYVSEV